MAGTRASIPAPLRACVATGYSACCDSQVISAQTVLPLRRCVTPQSFDSRLTMTRPRNPGHAQAVRADAADAVHNDVERTGSGHFVVPPDVRPGGYWCETLFS